MFLSKVFQIISNNLNLTSQIQDAYIGYTPLLHKRRPSCAMILLNILAHFMFQGFSVCKFVTNTNKHISKLVKLIFCLT